MISQGVGALVVMRPIRFHNRLFFLLILGLASTAGCDDAVVPAEEDSGPSSDADPEADSDIVDELACSGSWCGNGDCERDCGEQVRTCPEDCCPISCGDGTCQRETCGESGSSCPVDCCDLACGDGLCDPDNQRARRTYERLGMEETEYRLYEKTF